MDKIILHPVQANTSNHKRGTARVEITQAAYEVYCHVYSPQPALMDLEGRDCRGGFGVGELIAFLYARSFPKSEWKSRVNEAFEGLNVS